jgi:predicted transposase YbfD/YdcC
MTTPSIQILDYFGTIEDPRRTLHKQHHLDELLFIALCSLLAGGESFTEMAAFGEAREAWLRQFLRLPNGIPSHDTFRRVFGLLKPDAFVTCLVEWTQALRTQVAGEVVAIDGKSLRRSGRTKDTMAHLVSAWACTNRLVLGQLQVDGKSNEITAIPPLLRILELTGCIVTIDAMGCQKDIAKEIHEADADYVLALKGNQGTTHAEVQSFLDDAITRREPHLHGHDSGAEKDHGRLETRRYWISDQLDWFADRDQWENLRSVGVVESTRDLNGQTTTERRYFLTSLPPDAKVFAHAVRAHWGIENQLHWVLDVSLQEDQSRVRAGHAAANLALLRKWALNLLRLDTTKPGKSIRLRRLLAAMDVNYLRALLASKS